MNRLAHFFIFDWILFTAFLYVTECESSAMQTDIGEVLATSEAVVTKG
jgi:hypothetical protein